ncbi:MAG: histidine phosphotransferase [Sphingomonadales bacterium 32-64-17]|nr:MAG: histidine phosphotransferase [Sphingomonadales bacterium 32-64-17]
MTSSTDLAALLCSRLCHDMLSPVGALNNGLELLADERDPEMRARCLELLEQSARTTAMKLKFFRLAFGAAGGFGEQVPVEEPRELIEGLASGNARVSLDWALEVNSLSKPAVKILLNLAAIGLDSLVRGGTLLVGAERSDGATEIVIRAEGPKIAFDESIGRALAGELPESELTGRTAPAHMIHMLASENGGELRCARAEEMLVLGAALPPVPGMIG